MQVPLILTRNAAAKVWELMQEEDNFQLKLRVYITGGGCSGFQYGFKFDEQVNEEDTLITRKVMGEAPEDENSDEGGSVNGSHGPKVQLIVDPMSLQYLLGAEIDYTEGLEGAQFVIRNPNAKTTCGCGSSFSA